MGENSFIYDSKMAGSSRNVRHCIIWIMALLLGIIAGDRIVSLGMKKLVSISKMRYSMLYRGNIKADLIILGDSRAVDCCLSSDIERETKIRAYNLSYNGMSMELAESLIADYFDRYRPPKKIVIEAGCLSQSNNLIGDFSMYCQFSKRFQKLFENNNKKKALLCEFMNLAYFNSDMFLRAIYFLRRPDQKWINKGIISKEMIKMTNDMKPNIILVNRPENIAALRRVLILAKMKGSAISIIVAPIFPGYFKKISNYDSWFSELKYIAGKEAEIYDFSRSLLNNEDFADRVHVNIGGSEKLLDRMIKEGVFN